MKQLRKFSFSLGGFIIAAGTLMLTAPRAAHALAAALVQITNTAANPAITQNIGQPASQMVHLYCDLSGCIAYAPDGSRLETNGVYTVPSNSNFVITSADIASYLSAIHGNEVCSKETTVTLNGAPPSGYETWAWALAANAGTAHFTYPSGFALGPTTRIVGMNTNNTCPVTGDFYGYLTAN